MQITKSTTNAIRVRGFLLEFPVSFPSWVPEVTNICGEKSNFWSQITQPFIG